MLQPIRYALLVLLFFAIPALAENKYSTAVAGEPKLESGKAMVVFIRPAGYGNGVASSLYEIEGARPRILGIMYYNERMAMQFAPGPHRFMAHGSNSTFLDADLQAGKTYYVFVRSEVGRWKASFTLVPLRSAEGGDLSVHSPHFRKWMSRAQWMEKTAQADAWFSAHEAELTSDMQTALNATGDDATPIGQLGAAHAVAETE